MKKNILIIGVRRKCYQTALNLGHNVFLWSDEALSQKRKKHLNGFLEVPYKSCAFELTQEVKDFLDNNSINIVIACTEKSVQLGALARQHLGLKSLGLNIVERFHNKFTMKNTAHKAGIPMTPYRLIEKTTTHEELIEKLKLPVVIKPVDSSGAQDVRIAKDTEEVKALMKPGWLAESFVEGFEVSVESFVQDGKVLFHNMTHYLHQWKKSVAPAHLEEEIKKEVLRLNDAVIKDFGLDRGMTHAEFYITPKGPLFGEIAVRPPGGYYMELIQRVYGFDPWKAYIKLCCKESVDFPQSSQGHAAVMLLHPGVGEIVSVSGENILKEKLSEIVDFSLRCEPGDIITEHINTSNEVGHIIFWEKSWNDILSAIKVVEDHLVFEMKS